MNRNAMTIHSMGVLEPKSGVILCALFLAGCADEPGGPPATLKADTQDLETGTYVLDPGQEKYLCYTFRSPDVPKAIVRVEPVQNATVHHVALFQTTTPEPEGSFECPQLIGLNWEPIWAGGAGATALDLPKDVGFVIDPGTQYLIQYHLLNANSKPSSTAATIRVTYADDASAVTPAGIFALGGFSLTIPPLAMDYAKTVKCNPTHDLDVFAVFPHMHKLGRSLDLVVGKTEAEAREVYRTDPWVFGEQPMEPIDLKVAAGDHVQSTCRWNNPNATEVKFGESSNDEMCFTVMFYSPFTGLDGCIDP